MKNLHCNFKALKPIYISLLFVILFLSPFYSYSQPFTVSAGQGISTISSVSPCGTNYTFSFTTNNNWGKTIFIYDNAEPITNDWTISGLGFAYLNWEPGLVGINDGTSNNTTLHVEIDATNQSILFSTIPPECGVETPLISVSETSLTGFSYIYGSGPSLTQSYTVIGNNLTSPITISAPNGFEISVSEQNGFSASQVIDHNQGDVSQIIYVRLAAGGSVSNYTGNITHTSEEAENVLISLSGNIETTLTKEICIIAESVNETTYEVFTGGESVGEYISGNPDKICFTPVVDGVGADIYISIQESQNNSASDINIYLSDYETVQEIQVDGIVLSSSFYSFSENESGQMELYFYNIEQQPHNSFVIETGTNSQDKFIVDLQNGGFFKVSGSFLSQMNSYELSIQNEMNEGIYNTTVLNNEGALEWENIQLVSPGLYTYTVVSTDIQNNNISAHGKILVK